jgi:hypothetical protein
MAYKIYTSRNLADTIRDPDEIVIEDLGYKFNLEDAKLVANNYIKKSFFHKDTELKVRKDGTYTATDFCSYGATVIVEPITIS